MLSDSEIYFPPIKEGEMEKVYCERCKHLQRFGEIELCIEYKFGEGFTSARYGDPKMLNANHDCKDYEAKDERD